MGTLVGYHYASTLFLKLADHTYVACGTLGKAWACWGGKTGGSALRQAPGSTKRADAIAEPNERGGITCYLVNGVCHQAANRILSPAGITMRGVRGYSVSVSMFGTYGRPSALFGLCRAPFHRHPGINGDLPECIAGVGQPHAGGKRDDDDPRHREFLQRTLGMYAAVEGIGETFADPDRVVRFQMELFAAFVDYKLGEGEAGEYFFASPKRAQLMTLRENVEHKRIALEAQFVETRKVEAIAAINAFVKDYNDLIVRFQEKADALLDAEHYQALFDLKPGDYVWLGDPEIARDAYGPTFGQQGA